jgi:hypothetical protein
MPSKSPKQARTMAAIAHGWKPPKTSGINIPVSVAKDYNEADQKKRTASALVGALRKMNR